MLSAAPIATAASITNWAQLNGAVAVPLAGAETDGPTYGDGVTADSAQSAWVAGLFGTAASPESVTLSIGETLTVSGSVVLTGGGGANNQYRFGIFNDGGAFEAGSGSAWTGGWMHTIVNDLWQGRTDGPYISSAGNAVALNSTRTRSGTFTGNSATAYEFSMSVTRDSETTVDITSSCIGGDLAFSEVLVAEDVPTTLFTYTSCGWLLGGSSGVEQAIFSDVAFSVNGGTEPRILEIRSDGITTEIDYELPEGKFYFLESSLDMTSWQEELEDAISGAGTFVDDLSARFEAPLPTRVFYRLRDNAG